MLHKKRAWHVAHVSGPEDLAEKLTQHTWTSDQGFELGGYLFLNDSTGPDGAQEYAVVKKPQNPGEPYRQVESITFSWCGLEEGRRYVERCTAGEFDRADYVRPVEVRLLRTADEVEREPAKAEEGQASGRHEGPAVKHLWTPGHPPTREQMERAERAMAEGRRRLDDWLEWQARPDAVDFRVEGRPGEGLEFTPLTLRADTFTYDQDAEWRYGVRWRPKSFLMDAEKAESFVKDLRDKGFRIEQQQQVTDFRVTAEGTIWKFTAETEQAREFSRKALHVEPWQWLDANTFATEHRAAQGLLAVLEDNRWRINGPTHGQLKEETLMSTNYEANFANLTKLLGEKDHVRIENEGYMPLVVEAIWHDQISLCHYGEIDGDPARDPEVVFLIRLYPE